MIRSTLLATGLFAHLAAAETLLVPGQFSTIQSAVDFADEGDTILVSPGTYESFWIDTRTGDPGDITIRSTDGPGSTFLEKTDGVNEIVQLSANTQYPGGEFVLEGFTIANQDVGSNSEVTYLINVGQGLFQTTLQNLNFENCTITNGYLCYGGTHVSCNYSGCTSNAFDSDQALARSTVSGLFNCQFDGCSGQLVPTGTMQNCVVRNCSSENTGRPLLGTAELTGCEIADNVFNSSITGGGTITGCNFTRNQKSTNSSTNASVITTCNGFITDCHFEDNLGARGSCVRQIRGPGWSTCNSTGGDIYLTNCTFINNTATLQAAVAFTEPGPQGMVISGCTGCGNFPSEFSGPYQDGGSNFFEGSCITEVACCLGTACIELIETDCTNNGGEILDAPCSESNCSSEGACCISGTCTVTTVETCFSLGGSFAGNNTDCTTTNCQISCEGDISGNGDVGLTDLIAVLSNWGPCPE